MLASGASAYAYMLQTVVNDTTRARMSGASRRSLRWVHELAGYDDNLARDRTSRHEHNQHHHHHTHTTTTTSTTTITHIHLNNVDTIRGSLKPDTDDGDHGRRWGVLLLASTWLPDACLRHTQLPSLHARDRSTCHLHGVARSRRWRVACVGPHASCVGS
jgi:hypothetical protein